MGCWRVHDEIVLVVGGRGSAVERITRGGLVQRQRGRTLDPASSPDDGVSGSPPGSRCGRGGRDFGGRRRGGDGRQRGVRVASSPGGKREEDTSEARTRVAKGGEREGED